MAILGIPRNAKSPTLRAGLSARTVNRFCGSPTWARTKDLRINSPALYRLSYRGTEARMLVSKCSPVKAMQDILPKNSLFLWIRN